MDVNSNAFGQCGNLSIINVHPENTHYSSVNGVLFNKDQTVLLRCPINYAAPSYEIPYGVTAIGEGAFQDCSDLTEIIIPESVTEMGIGAFTRCGIRQLPIPGSIKIISHFAFYGCFNLVDAAIPDGVQRIENYSFGNCRNLTQVTIPASVEKIGGRVFSGSYRLEHFTLEIVHIHNF